jgi:hypothetical protein
MITLPSDVLALLDAGRISIRGLIRFDLGSGTYGFVRSVQPLTWSGVTYQPGGLISVSDLDSSMDGSAQAFTVKLAASPDDELTPEVLLTIEAEDYRDRPVTIYDAYFHPDTGGLLHVQALKRGYIDTIDHFDDPEDGYTLEAKCESRALDYTRTNGRRRTVVDQARRAPGDLFFEHAAMRGREVIFWGREKAAAPRPQVPRSTTPRRR